MIGFLRIESDGHKIDPPRRAWQAGITDILWRENRRPNVWRIEDGREVRILPSDDPEAASRRGSVFVFILRDGFVYRVSEPVRFGSPVIYYCRCVAGEIVRADSLKELESCRK